jgi:diacylglycerol kinase family enzyme
VSAVRTAVVANPTGNLDLAALRTGLTTGLAAAGWPAPDWYETTADDPGRGQTRRAVEAGAEVVFVGGGDGTVRACVDGLAGTAVALAVVPGGTGNLLAANLSLPSNVDECVAAATAGRRRRLDLGCVDGQHLALMTGMGFDAAMMDATPETWKRRIGWPAYLVGGARRLWDRPMRLEIRLDDGPVLNRSARMVLVANVGRMQGGVDLFGNAEPDDGQLDVAVVRPRHLGEVLALAIALVLHKKRSPRSVETFQASTVDIRARGRQPREIDGDLLPPADRLTAAVVPAALWVCVP